MGFDQHVGLAHDFLPQGHGCSLHLFRLGRDNEDIVHAGGLEEFNRYRPHHECESRLPFDRLEQRALIGTDPAQVVGSPARYRNWLNVFRSFIVDS
jgi:hypothetical protein